MSETEKFSKIQLGVPDPAYDVSGGWENEQPWTVTVGGVEKNVSRVIRDDASIISGLDRKLNLALSDFAEDEFSGVLAAAYYDLKSLAGRLSREDRQGIVQSLKASTVYKESKIRTADYFETLHSGDFQDLPPFEEHPKIFAAAFFDQHLIPILENVQDTSVESEEVEPCRLTVANA